MCHSHCLGYITTQDTVLKPLEDSQYDTGDIPVASTSRTPEGRADCWYPMVVFELVNPQ